MLRGRGASKQGGQGHSTSAGLPSSLWSPKVPQNQEGPQRVPGAGITRVFVLFPPERDSFQEPFNVFMEP